MELLNKNMYLYRRLSQKAAQAASGQMFFIMKIIEFKQVDIEKRKFLLAVYFVLAVCFIIYAFASNPIISFVNSFQRGVVPGILACIIFIVPLTLILSYTSHKATIIFNENGMEIKNRNKLTNICYPEVNTMHLNKKKLGTLELLNAQQNPLFVFVTENNDTTPKKVLSEITKKKEFKKTTQKVEKRMLNHTLKYDITTYTQR